MARKADPQTPNIVRSGINNGYRYAYIQKLVPVGKEPNVQQKRRKIQLGRLTDNNVFEPNNTFRLMDIDQRRALIFPKEWDVSQANALDAIHSYDQNPPISDHNASSESATDDTSDTVNLENEEDMSDLDVVDSNGLSNTVVTVTQICYSCKIYGAAWLLEQIAETKGVTDDLLEAFRGNIGSVEDVLTLVVYSILEGAPFSRLDRWLDTHKAATDHRFGSDYVTRCTQNITEDHRMRFIELRLKRQAESSIASIDSSTRSGYGKCLVDLRYGHNKDREDLPCTLEVYVYSLTSHEPIYYKRMPGNTSDMVTIRTILADLKELDFKQDNLSFMADRGYCSKENMGLFHKVGSPFLLCAKVNQAPVIKCLLDIKYNRIGLPINMEYDTESKLYYSQADAEDFTVTLDDGEEYTVHGVKVNMFMKPDDRLKEATKVSIEVETEIVKVKDYIEGRTPMPAVETMRSALKYHYVRVDKETKKIEFEFNQSAEDKAYAQCGFFASCMYKYSFNAIEAYREYKTRDEHEKNFFCLKQDEGADMQDCSSEEGAEGRSFIYFVGLILLNTLKFTRKEKLKQSYKTSYEVLDAMSTIRYSEYISGNYHMTTFNSEHIRICDAFGITPPTECMTNTAKEQWRRKYNPKKRGRKPNATNKVG